MHLRAVSLVDARLAGVHIKEITAPKTCWAAPGKCSGAIGNMFLSEETNRWQRKKMIVNRMKLNI